MEQITFEQLPTAITALIQKVEQIECLLLQRADPKAPEDEILTIKEAAQLLSLSVPTIYSLVSKSQIPVSKKGKRLYFLKQEITSWIKDGRKRTIQEIELAAKQYVKSKKF